MWSRWVSWVNWLECVDAGLYIQWNWLVTSSAYCWLAYSRITDRFALMQSILQFYVVNSVFILCSIITSLTQSCLSHWKEDWLTVQQNPWLGRYHDYVQYLQFRYFDRINRNCTQNAQYCFIERKDFCRKAQSMAWSVLTSTWCTSLCNKFTVVSHLNQRQICENVWKISGTVKNICKDNKNSLKGLSANFFTATI